METPDTSLLVSLSSPQQANINPHSLANNALFQDPQPCDDRPVVFVIGDFKADNSREQSKSVNNKIQIILARLGVVEINQQGGTRRTAN
eukprot:7713374-Heterocapsa_arctica.AAC.1